MTKEITPQMIEDGEIDVQVYGMVRMLGKAVPCISLPFEYPPEFFNVLLRPLTEKFWPNGATDPIEEHENLSWEQAQDLVAAYEKRFPGICVDYIC